MQNKHWGAFFFGSVLIAMAVWVDGRLAWADCTLTSTGKTPLNDLGEGLYLGEIGGLYPDGTNVRPAAHDAAGIQIALNEIKPLNAAGNDDPVNGTIALVSIGMSNTTQEFATRGPGAFKPRSDADPARNPRVVVVDCAQGGRAAREWIDPDNDAWTVMAQRLTNAGVAPLQVQVAWVKLAERTSDVPDRSFPAHALFHQGRIAEILRMLKSRYPNVRLAFLSSRTRSYENNPFSLNPEPFAYEENFSVKWLIEGQINGTDNLNYNATGGAVVAPYLAWGPYIWTDGEDPRSDGFVWHCSDLVGDYTHPSESGVWKVADQLIAFFKTDPLATPWYLRTNVVGQPPTVQIQANTTTGQAPLTVHFTAAASDPDGTILETVWTFGDGGFSMSTAPVKIFPVPGVYTVRVTVTDDDGNPVSASKTITVLGPGGDAPAVSASGMIATFLLTCLAAFLFSRSSSDAAG
jgi:hypothetical protein